MGVRIQELPETTGINKEDVLIVEDGQGTKKGTVQQLDETLGVSQLKEDLAEHVKESQKAIEDLNDKKIAKFYANSLGETTLNDSDKGKIRDMILYGKSLQNGTPTPDNPIEIQSVVNLKLSVCGKNFVNKSFFDKYYLYSQEYGGYKGQMQVQYLNFSKLYNIALLEDGVIYKFIADLKNPSVDGIDFFYLYVKYEDGTTQTTEKIKLKDVFVHLELVTNGKKISEIYVNYGIGGIIIFKEMPRLIRANEEQSATLPYTLNAIPVSSGGNVTIDGQQYIADYVDIENNKLVRMVGEVDLGTLSFVHEDISFRSALPNLKYLNSNTPIYALCEKYYAVSFDSAWDTTGMMSRDGSERIVFINKEISDVSEFVNSVSGIKLIYALKTPTITNLTDEEVKAFKDLSTYYGTTNIINSSDQLDGFTTFNYPVSLKNGWEYVKQQIGDTREYIYDMELQSAEAFVNSEYAVALIELGV